MELNEREKAILETADELLNDKSAGRVGINSAFFYRFNPKWVKWVKQTRRMLAVIAGPDLPFDFDEEGWKWEWRVKKHLETVITGEFGNERNEWAAVAPKSDPMNGNKTYKQTIEFDEKKREYYFRIPAQRMDGISEQEDPDLWARLYEPDDGRHFLERRRNLSSEEEQAIFMEKWARVNQITKFLNEVERMAFVYDLDFDAVLNHVLYGRLPTMKDYDGDWLHNPRNDVINIDLAHRDTPRKTERKRGRRKGQMGMYPETIVRTWGIFLLTQDGGGERSENAALRIWNERFANFSTDEDGANYRKDLERMIPTKERETDDESERG